MTYVQGQNDRDWSLQTMVSITKQKLLMRMYDAGCDSMKNRFVMAPPQIKINSNFAKGEHTVTDYDVTGQYIYCRRTVWK